MNQDKKQLNKKPYKIDTVGIVFLSLFLVFCLIIILAFIVKACQRSVLSVSFSKTKPTSPTLNDRKWPIIFENDLFFDRYVRSQAHAFLIDDDGRPWYKVISKVKTASNVLFSTDKSKTEGWKPLFWENFYNRKVDKLMVDGANLMLWDNKGFVHYRKVLKDKRSGKDDLLYEFVDKVNKTNYWFPGWSLTLVVLDHLSSRLQVPKNNQVAMAHRGFWNSYVQNVKTGQKYHEVKVVGGNTSLYRYDGEFVYLADALCPGTYIKKFQVPEKLDRVRLCGSASVVCFMGYQPITGIWRGYWKLVDLDTLGFMPHVNFYTKVGTEWITIPAVPSDDKTLDMKGCLIVNKGNNTRQLETWFTSDKNKNLIMKAEIKLERNATWNVKLIE